MVSVIIRLERISGWKSGQKPSEMLDQRIIWGGKNAGQVPAKPHTHVVSPTFMGRNSLSGAEPTLFLDSVSFRTVRPPDLIPLGLVSPPGGHGPREHRGI